MSALLPALAGSSVIYGMGMIELGMTISYDQMVIDAEIVKMVRRIMDGIAVNDDTLAEEVIKAVGPAGTYLGEKHTRKFMRKESSVTRLFDRQMYDGWVNDGSKDVQERAHEEALRILREHQPMPLAPEAAKAIHSIVLEEAGALAERKAFEDRRK
jgi:trimethylamine--corrinoid protein Co-methyltransferase